MDKDSKGSGFTPTAKYQNKEHTIPPFCIPKLRAGFLSTWHPSQVALCRNLQFGEIIYW